MANHNVSRSSSLKSSNIYMISTSPSESPLLVPVKEAIAFAGMSASVPDPQAGSMSARNCFFNGITLVFLELEEVVPVPPTMLISLNPTMKPICKLTVHHRPRRGATPPGIPQSQNISENQPNLRKYTGVLKFRTHTYEDLFESSEMISPRMSCFHVGQVFFQPHDCNTRGTNPNSILSNCINQTLRLLCLGRHQIFIHRNGGFLCSNCLPQMSLSWCQPSIPCKIHHAIELLTHQRFVSTTEINTNIIVGSKTLSCFVRINTQTAMKKCDKPTKSSTRWSDLQTQKPIHL